jgi:hypothetical protein
MPVSCKREDIEYKKVNQELGMVPIPAIPAFRSKGRRITSSRPTWAI